MRRWKRTPGYLCGVHHFTVERIKETCPHPLVMVEERLDYSYLVPSGFGTGDCVIIADGTLYVMDYKNGKGVFVNCDHNPQMMLYALGAYHAYGYLYSIKKVSMTNYPAETGKCLNV